MSETKKNSQPIATKLSTREKVAIVTVVALTGAAAIAYASLSYRVGANQATTDLILLTLQEQEIIGKVQFGS